MAKLRRAAYVQFVKWPKCGIAAAIASREGGRCSVRPNRSLLRLEFKRRTQGAARFDAGEADTCVSSMAGASRGHLYPALHGNVPRDWPLELRRSGRVAPFLCPCWYCHLPWRVSAHRRQVSVLAFAGRPVLHGGPWLADIIFDRCEVSGLTNKLGGGDMGWIRSLFGRTRQSTPPGVLDRVLIARVPAEAEALRNQSGRVEMIIDGRTAFIRLDSGAQVTLDISCLDRI